jgi:hypothetical protein
LAKELERSPLEAQITQRAHAVRRQPRVDEKGGPGAQYTEPAMDGQYSTQGVGRLACLWRSDNCAARPSLRPSLELSEAVGHHGKSAHRGAAEHTEAWDRASRAWMEPRLEALSGIRHSP